jgi:hypothetical protein
VISLPFFGGLAKPPSLSSRKEKGEACRVGGTGGKGESRLRKSIMWVRMLFFEMLYPFPPFTENCKVPICEERERDEEMRPEREN